MIIKKMYQTQKFPYHKVVKTLDDKYMMFKIIPARQITEKDLTPVPYYAEKGKNAEEAPIYFYQMYGLEKPSEKEG